MADLNEKVPMTEVLAVVARKKTEAVTGKPAPVEAFICRACGSLFEDKAATKLAHGKKSACCEGDRITKVDANSLKFNKDGEIVAAIHLE